MLGFLRECPAALSPLSGDFLSGEVLLLAFVLLSNRGMEASMSVEKSVMLLGLLAMIDSERVRERLATVFAVTNEADADDTGDIVVVEANDTRREYSSV
jgi:hypothetical protein